ncbi:MAG: hypothetical protein KDH17_15875 [Rhodocyclaceae bacterium]|nr:hypothetical protein [Rhodocyclaceae bacterium]
MAAVLQRLPAQMRDGFRKGFDVNSESTSPGQRAQIEAALEGAYSTDRMQASVLDRVRRGLDHDQAEALLRWYHGALGTEITRLETAGLGDERTGEQIIAENSARIADMSPRRRALLARAIAASRAIQMAENLVINTTLGLEHGTRAARGQETGPDELTQLRSRLETSRPALGEAFLSLSMAISAEAYRALSIEQLAAYVDFLESPAGSHFHEIGVAALDTVLLDAARLLGRLLPLTDRPSI